MNVQSEIKYSGAVCVDLRNLRHETQTSVINEKRTHKLNPCLVLTRYLL